MGLGAKTESIGSIAKKSDLRLEPRARHLTVVPEEIVGEGYGIPQMLQAWYDEEQAVEKIMNEDRNMRRLGAGLFVVGMLSVGYMVAKEKTDTYRLRR